MQNITINTPRKRIYHNILETIGGTPLVELHGVTDHPSIKKNTKILVKLECFNPMSSVKDRVGFNIIYQAIKDGRLKPGMEIIEATSGNTGIGLCQAGAVFGYPVNIVMPSTMSVERQMIMKAFGANLVLSDGTKGMPGAIAKYEELIKQHPNKYFPANQFGNPDNTAAHVYTANEIWEDTNGEVDIIVSAVGTAGTVIGVGENLKKKKKGVKVVAVEPAESAVLSGKPKGPHGIQGIGAGFVTDIYKKEVVDEITPIKTQDAWKMARAVVKYDGIMCGMSSGAAILAGLKEAGKVENEGKTIVIILPDCGERYLSTDLYKTIEEGTKQQVLDSLLL
ncbi:cysteine synthase a putative [Entamoeba histolytica]|uniref:Cysteine synthase A, putative n=4 Tax=Entamoeba histolytica TaxID=5759 RepID=A0A8U0WPI6_ENTH1|nr:cysteine synthase A, putative [Entamoeba histolytica HM-1:IMSS]EAL47859.1 cysteine synthase A, putative [Entamoeba histolytica HM-1:IMSS]EMD46065.1 cysteine synthase, putative [Entamoeba histolytica KU27]BAE19925.1 cysteine synthase 3 [Entamoeba histolytica]GAT97107.1 cysteine synthase a putative [Entamoeba histolytica]|eukprot:XP_653246.1 cysteine synthase A, putative [Entamoeba histolytica HM-1:IMSS]